MHGVQDTTNRIYYALRIIGIIILAATILLFLFFLFSYNLYDDTLIILIASTVSGIIFLGFAEIIIQLQKTNDRLNAIVENQNSMYLKVATEINRINDMDKAKEVKELLTEYNNLLAQNKYDEAQEVLAKIQEKQS